MYSIPKQALEYSLGRKSAELYQGRSSLQSWFFLLTEVLILFQ